MRKKTIAWLFIPGIILSIVGVALYLPGLMSAAQAAQTNPGSVPQMGAGFAIGLIVLFIGSILNFISWIGTLVAMAKLGRWGWFVCAILFSGITEIIYLIAGPGLPPKQG